MPRPEILQRFSNVTDIHRVNLQSTPDVAQQGDGEFSAEVFAEFLQPLQHPQLARSGYGLEFGIKQSESQTFQEAQDAFGCRTSEQALSDRIQHIQGDADGHRLAMPEPVTAHLLELVGGPMSEIERTRTSLSK